MDKHSDTVTPISQDDYRLTSSSLGEREDAPAPPAVPPKRKFYIERSFSDMTMVDSESIKITREEKQKDFDYVMNVLLEWPNSDTWPIKIGSPILGFAAASSGWLLNRAFREALVLGRYSNFASFLAVMGIPGITAGILHFGFITSDVLTQRTGCPVCVQVKGGCMQGALGILFPTIFVPIVNFSIANAMKHLYFPKLWKDPKPTLTFALDVFRSVRKPALGMTAFQIALGMGVTYLEQHCYFESIWPVISGEKKLEKTKRF